MIQSTLSLSAILAVVAVALTALWVGFRPRQQGSQEKRASAVAPLSQQQRSGLDANGQAIRTITPGSTTSSGMVSTAPTGPTPPAVPPIIQTIKPDASADPGSPERQTYSTSVAPTETGITPGAVNNPSATVGLSVDLNTATVEQLNALGAGMIGKRIIEFRPYTSADELLTRRVLKRSDYEAIKNSVTVR